MLIGAFRKSKREIAHFGVTALGMRVEAIFIMIMTCATAALGASLERLPLESVIENASIVARVRVIDKRTIKIDGAEGPEVCGFRFHARVLQDFKGGVDEIEFFSLTDIDFSGFDNDYFLVAEERTEEQLRILRAQDRANMRGRDLEKSLCGLQDKYFIRVNVQSLIPFWTPSESSRGEEWLRVSRMSIVSENRFQHIPADEDDKSELFKWDDIRRAVELAIADQKGHG